MNKKKRNNIMFLEDMFLAMQRIEEYIKGHNFNSFKKDYKTVDAVIRNFEIIGEAAKNINKNIKLKILMFPGKKCIC